MRRLSANNTLYKQDINDSISNLSRAKISLLNYCRGNTDFLKQRTMIMVLYVFSITLCTKIFSVLTKPL